MPALTVGKKAPDISLPLLGGGNFSLEDALKKGPVVLAFFKISCPVCQFAFPYLQRLYEAFKETDFTIIGVSQNDEAATAQFAREYGITFPIALDDQKKYPASNAYGLTNVPTVFYVASDGSIKESSVGWSRDDIEAIARDASEGTKVPAPALFKPGEDVAAFRAG